MQLYSCKRQKRNVKFNTKKMKNLSNLEGVEKLSIEAQKSIIGGGPIKAICPPEPPVCPEGNPDCEEIQYYNIWCVNR